MKKKGFSQTSNILAFCDAMMEVATEYEIVLPKNSERKMNDDADRAVIRKSLWNAIDRQCHRIISS